MFSSTKLHKDGAQIWSASHNAQDGIYNLQTEGALPDFYSEIRERLTDQQDQAGGDKAKVDHVFDVPVEVAKSMCGYRHDLCRYDWGEPYFTTLQERRGGRGWKFWKKTS